jgi:hypothetical protein
MARGTHANASARRHEFLLVVLGLFRKGILPLSDFLFGQIESFAEVDRPLQGRADAIVAGPCSLQIRIAPRCPWRRPRLRFGRPGCSRPCLSRQFHRQRQ